MPIHIGWAEILLRLGLAVLAGGILGINRTERGTSAGLRTTLLVCLAAAVSMIQANLLLAVEGRSQNSFIMMDLMRLPLGILTGMGFIGAGAILRKGDKINGVTTAATLWLATVLGLCFGGGQHGLGLTALGIGVVILWGLKLLELRIKQERRARLIVQVLESGPTDQDIRGQLESHGYQVAAWDVTFRRRTEARSRIVRSELHWSAEVSDTHTPVFVQQLASQPGVLALRWKV